MLAECDIDKRPQVLWAYTRIDSLAIKREAGSGMKKPKKRKRLKTMGLLLAALNLIPAAEVRAASFNCSKATTKIEQMICADPELSRLDEEMAEAYKAALQDEVPAEDIRRAQKRWLKERNRCADVVCLKKTYKGRLQKLESTGAVTGSDGTPTPGSASGQKPLYGHCVDVQNPHNCGKQSGKGYAVCEDYLRYLNTLDKLPVCEVVVPPGFQRPAWEELEVMQHLDWAYQAETFSHLGTDEDFRKEYPDETTFIKKILEEMRNDKIVPAMRTTKVRPIAGGEEITLLAYTRNRRACMDVVQGKLDGSYWAGIGYAHFRIMDSPDRHLAEIPGGLSWSMELLLHKGRPYFVWEVTSGYALPSWGIFTFGPDLFFHSTDEQMDQRYWVEDQCEFDPLERKSVRIHRKGEQP